MNDPYGLLQPDFDASSAMKDLEDYVNPPLQLQVKPIKKRHEAVLNTSTYDYRAHLEAHLTRGLKQGCLDVPTCMTIRYCFADIYRLFQEKCAHRKNFLSYTFFINRILELHGKQECVFGKEPVSLGSVRQNWRLWYAYGEWVQYQMDTQEVPIASRNSWLKYRQWQTLT